MTIVQRREQPGTEPRLDKPGAGLPFTEWFVAKYIYFPQRFRSVSPGQALDEFARESESISGKVATLSLEQLRERRLIPRLRGLEDSSRYWSVAMTLEHLIIVNSAMKNVILNLSEGIVSDGVKSTADVKPSIEVNAAEIREKFEAATHDFVAKVSSCNLENFPHAKQAHPWFGPLTAKQLVLFGAPHMSIHKHQIAEIIKRF